MGIANRLEHKLHRSMLALTAAGLGACAAVSLMGSALAVPANGTTLAATKTIEKICEVDENTWRYSGEISVWNEGAVITQGLKLFDCIEYKAADDRGQPVCVTALTVPGSNLTPNPNPLPYSTPTGGFSLLRDPSNNYVTTNPSNQYIKAGTPQSEAVVFGYSVDGPALSTDGTIRNSAKITITNHSGHLNAPGGWGPNPKYTWLPQPIESCDTGGDENFGCTYTIGYWRQFFPSPANHVWPAGTSPDNLWFSAGNPIPGETWGTAIVAGGDHNNAYWQLARAYIGAVLNVAKNGSAPQGVLDNITWAAGYFSTAQPAACEPAKGGPNGHPAGAAYPCSEQITRAGILQTYNEGHTVGGPLHCADDDRTGLND